MYKILPSCKSFSNSKAIHSNVLEEAPDFQKGTHSESGLVWVFPLPLSIINFHPLTTCLEMNNFPNLSWQNHVHDVSVTFSVMRSVQRFSSILSQGFEDEDLGSSPDWWTATVATYCPSRLGELPKSSASKPCNREYRVRHLPGYLFSV